MAEQKEALEALKGWTEEQKAAVLEALLQEAVANWPSEGNALFDPGEGIAGGPGSELNLLSEHWSADRVEGDGRNLPMVSVLENLALFSLGSVGARDFVLEFVERANDDPLTDVVVFALTTLLKGEVEDSESEED